MIGPRQLKPATYLVDIGATAAVCFMATGSIGASLGLAVLMVAKQEVFNHYLQIGLKRQIERLR